MFRKPRKINQYRRKGKNLIATNKIKPEHWNISDAETKKALKVKGYDVKQIKKIHLLKHQVCISYWDTKGNICSSFFSYRIFARWQKEVEKLIYTCQTLKEWVKLNYVMKYEFAYYHYPNEIEDALDTILENHLCLLKTTEQQVILQYL
ncbi:hypothetical protein NIES4072_58680 [Nostoc commune NIES-4072]|uniref:Uncharacterized protein n=1 Tax=Nostoc commune NIES-4072 TaxID=2005467 RepID=A0A2R5G261_NOSCO|nr:hypothetical protein [Nostoc commune]BBD66855.1 hypothetical protein NIES4070_32250 [Nostoc commune HK-02]GBG22161.1 hypothetical protein NIES4072_58680 [Nostoc commune NIES-4072]